MKLREILDIIEDTAISNKLSKPLIVGGVPRDRVRGEPKEINDIDLTSMEGDSVQLAYACFATIPNTFFQFFDDGHACLKIGKLQFDFSNHFLIPNIDAELDRFNVKDHSPLIKELYSRDFTINTLLQDLKFEQVYDLTGKAVNDIHSGIVRCPIDPELTIKNDPKRILRALRFALRFNYTIDPDLTFAIKKYRDLLKKASPEYIKDKVNELIKLNPERSIKLMIELGLLTVIPMTKLVSDQLIKNKLLYYAFE